MDPNVNEERYCNEPDSVKSQTRSSVSPSTDSYLAPISDRACVRLWIYIRWYPDQSPETLQNRIMVSSASALRLPPDRRLSGPILGGGDPAVPDTMAQRKPNGHQCHRGALYDQQSPGVGSELYLFV
ncbi:hypothetical protein DPMN_091097 [Dreissena polymorpha]|uniref:Uncharacterized protein n=1 Tax=Dreissena polymorpha TaxID=45954 RepID=A0A9D4QZP1_DREPO|nr:hypothetical protein DPMN_091097 [Dreissena polymorpha]